MTLGSLGAFLVMEEAGHAKARGAKPLARLRAVETQQVRRKPRAVTSALQNMWSKLAPNIDPAGLAIVSGATGVAPATAEEQEFLAPHRDIAVRTTGNHIGHGLEPQFPMNVALAAVALGHGRIFSSFDTSGIERAMDAPLRQVAVTGVGHWRGEAVALLEAVG
jgi:3-oxoacyl-[acyl-carrier-protein] synthase II